MFNQNDHGWKKDQLQIKFKFLQLNAKITNFADIKRKNII